MIVWFGIKSPVQNKLPLEFRAHFSFLQSSGVDEKLDDSLVIVCSLFLRR